MIGSYLYALVKLIEEINTPLAFYVLSLFFATALFWRSLTATPNEIHDKTRICGMAIASALFLLTVFIFTFLVLSKWSNLIVETMGV